MGQLQSHWHAFFSFISSVTEHQTLITGSDIFFVSQIVGNTLGNISRLLVQSDQNVHCFVVKTFVRVIVTDTFDTVSKNSFVVNVSLRGDFTANHDHTGLGESLACDLGVWVLGQVGVEDGIAYLITDLVWVTFADRLGGEKEGCSVLVA